MERAERRDGRRVVEGICGEERVCGLLDGEVRSEFSSATQPHP